MRASCSIFVLDRYVFLMLDLELRGLRARVRLNTIHLPTYEMDERPQAGPCSPAAGKPRP